MLNNLKCEYLKFFYNRWVVFTLILTILFTPAFVIFLHATPAHITREYVLTQILESFYLGQAGIIVITILYWGQEFFKSTLRSSLLVAPNKIKFIASKLVVLFSISILTWLIISMLTMLVSSMYYKFELSIVWLGKFVFVVSFLSTSLVVICTSLVMLTKSLTVSMALSVAFLLGLGHMLLQFSNIFMFSPIIATMNVFFIESKPTYLSMPLGLLVQSIWAISMLTIAIKIFKMRSVR